MVSLTIKATFSESEKYVYDFIIEEAKRQGKSVSKLVKEILIDWYKRKVGTSVFDVEIVRPKIEYGIDAKGVRIDKLDPLTYLLLKRLNLTKYFMKYKRAIRVKGIPSVYFVTIDEQYEIAQLLNKLLELDVDNKIKTYIKEANIIAKERGVKELIEYHKRDIIPLLRKYFSIIEKEEQADQGVREGTNAHLTLSGGSGVA